MTDEAERWRQKYEYALECLGELGAIGLRMEKGLREIEAMGHDPGCYLKQRPEGGGDLCDCRLRVARRALSGEE